MQFSIFSNILLFVPLVWWKLFLFLQYTEMSDSEMLACMSILDDQLKYSAKAKAVQPLITKCKVLLIIWYYVNFSRFNLCVLWLFLVFENWRKETCMNLFLFSLKFCKDAFVEIQHLILNVQLVDMITLDIFFVIHRHFMV